MGPDKLFVLLAVSFLSLVLFGHVTDGSGEYDRALHETLAGCKPGEKTYLCLERMSELAFRGHNEELEFDSVPKCDHIERPQLDDQDEQEESEEEEIFFVFFNECDKCCEDNKMKRSSGVFNFCYCEVAAPVKDSPSIDEKNQVQIDRDASECREIEIPGIGFGLWLEDDAIHKKYSERLETARNACINCCFKHGYTDWFESSGKCVCADPIPPSDAPTLYDF